MSIFRTDDTVHIKIIRPWKIAKKFANWNEEKYGEPEIGTSIDASILKDDTIKFVVLIFPECDMHVRTTVKKIREYLDDTPQASSMKFGKKEIIIPLSICEDVPKDAEYDVDINQF